MRIVENNDVIELTCQGCGSVLESECDDVETCDIGHGHASEFWVHCAVCGKEIAFPRDSIPNRWLSDIFINNNIQD